MNYNFYEHNKVLINDLKKCINRTNVTIKEEEVGYYESYITFENSGWCDIFLENFNRALYLNNKINKIIWIIAFILFILMIITITYQEIVTASKMRIVGSTH